MSLLAEDRILKLLNDADPNNLEAFNTAYQTTKLSLEPFGYIEASQVLGLEHVSCQILGRALVSEARVVFVTLKIPDGNMSLQFFRDDSKSVNVNLKAQSLFGGFDGFSDFCYSYVEKIAPVTANPGALEYAKEIQSYISRLLKSAHMQLILDGTFWHNYEFDLRESLLGDFTDKDLQKYLQKSLKDQGFKE